MHALPILLIHGFNGQPANWTDTSDRFPELLAGQGFERSLIRVFSYGFVEEAGQVVYDSTGDMRAIAHRLDESSSPDLDTRSAAVDQLSRDSVAAGGPPGVTLIAHSSGGLVARYYLSCVQPDEFGTVYRGNVARLIMLGTPHRGVDLEDVLDPMPTPLAVGLLARLHPAFPRANLQQIRALRDELRGFVRANREPFLNAPVRAGGPGYRQFHPDSAFLRALNRPGAMPGGVAYDNIIGDVRVELDVGLGGRRALHLSKELGDLLVSTYSAGSVPNAPSTCYPLAQRHTLQLTLGGELLLAELEVRGVQPIPLHRDLRSHPAAHQIILEILKKT